MTEKKLDILFFDARSVYESKELEHKLKWYKNAYSRSKEYTDILPGEEFFNKMISSGDFFVSACMYMFSKELIQRYGILFIDGILYEDNVFTFKLLMHAHRVSHIRKQFYLRLVRNDSIVTKKIKPINIYSYFRCFTEIYFFAKDHLSSKLTQKNTIIFMNSLTRQMISQAQKLNSLDSRSSCDLLDKYLINFWLTQLTHTPKNSKINRATQLTKKTFKSLASDGLLSTAKKIARWLYRK